MLKRPAAWLRRGLALGPMVLDLWRRDYRDARLIVEQGGDLQYFAVPGRLQRLVVRGSLVVVGVLGSALLVMTVAALVLQLNRLQEERRHQAIYLALADSFQEVGFADSERLSTDEMLSLARTIRERDQEIRRLVDSATTQLSSENADFKSLLDGTGLTEKAIKIIHGSTAMGGFGPREGVDVGLEKLMPVVSGSFLDEAADNRLLRDVMLALPANLPVSDHRLTSRFGIRKHPIQGQARLHTGIDLVPHTDDRVYPAKDGKVVLARDYSNYGKTVIVRHDRGIESLYAHLDRIDVTEGQNVDRATVLGMVGNTGASTGKHLHFEISVGGYPVDPLKVIQTAQHVQHLKN
ncbi:M23 family metallopeptidase [Hydrogenophaga sp.]|uniref:M23 family metallopeptidase n=1 Tax=Hydrogenophaga sp. TaxID=1904254 RepID=UPI003F6CD72F